MKNLTITKHNKIIEASFRLTLSEQRILLSCIAQIDSRPGAPLITSENKFEVTASAIADLVGVSMDQAYYDLARSADRLYERSITIDNPTPQEPWTKLKSRWISGIAYAQKEGKLRLTFASDVIPYISQLVGEFTRYKLSYVAQMKSMYAIRLYELLVQWQGTGEREIEVDWLRQQFQIGDKYKTIKDLKRRVVQPAVDEINEHSNLWVTFGQRKIAQRISHFQFKFGEKQKPPQLIQDSKLSTPVQYQEQDPKVIDIMKTVAVYNIQPEVILVAIKKYGLDETIECRNYALKSIEQKKGTAVPIVNTAGYVAKCFKHGWGISTPEQKAERAKIDAEKELREQQKCNQQALKIIQDDVVQNRKEFLRTLRDNMSSEREEELKKEFIQNGLPELMQPVFKLKGWKGPGILPVYRSWLERKLLPPFDDDLRSHAINKGITLEQLVAL